VGVGGGPVHTARRQSAPGSGRGPDGGLGRNLRAVAMIQTSGHRARVREGGHGSSEGPEGRQQWKKAGGVRRWTPAGKIGRAFIGEFKTNGRMAA